MKICIIPQHMAATAFLLRTLNPPIKPHRTTNSTTVAAVARRSSVILTSLLLSTQPIFTNPATALDFRLTVPDQTIEEAQSGIQSHAQSLLKVKDLLTAESWKEAQKSLRKSSSLLKQDIYTIIQAKPAGERPLLRKLYADLFNGVTKLDYAARDKDRIRVWDSYESIVSSLDGILSRI